MKCKATKRDGNPCGHNAAKGREHCRFHGGHAPRGAAHPGFKHGKRSKFLPANLAAKFKESMQDPTLLEYRESIALLNARRWALIEAGESGLLWAKAKAAFDDLVRANGENDQAGIRVALNTLHDLFNRGHQDSIRWREVYDLIEREGRTKEREHRRLERMEAMISAEQFLAFVGLMINVITEAVEDKDTLRMITRSIDQIWASQGIGVAGSTTH